MKYRSLFDEFDEVDVDCEIQVRRSDRVTLRPYQLEAVASVFQEWQSGNQATLVCLPTGTGKSVVFSEVMRRFVEAN